MTAARQRREQVMSHEKLIERLRDSYAVDAEIRFEAADALERLEAHNNELADWREATKDRAEAAELKRDETLCELAEAQVREERKDAALKPFADYADPRREMPSDMAVTAGSAMAKRQITMGDCYAANEALAAPAPGKDSEGKE